MAGHPEYRSILNLVGARTDRVIAGSETITVDPEGTITIQWREVPNPPWATKSRKVVLMVAANDTEQEF